MVTLRGKFERSTTVSFMIKDIDGKVVMNLPKQSLIQGSLNYSFNTNALSNGIYFVFVEDGVNSFVKKMIVAH